MIALTVAVLIPIAVNLFYQVAPSYIQSSAVRIDLTPISFTVSTTIIAFGVFGLRIFDLIPVARYTVLEHIPEMVFVVDAQDRVIDANTVAQKMLGIPMSEIIGNSSSTGFYGEVAHVRRSRFRVIRRIHLKLLRSLYTISLRA
jgi:PAS domain-containing protein